MIEILEAGLQATVQDRGRPGFGHLGVPEAGAADPRSLDLGNRLVGNAPGSAAIEFLLGGLAVRFLADHSFALVGAPVGATLDGKPIAFGALVRARAEQVLRTTRTSQALRTYLALAGGIDVEPVLGSRSTDTLSGLGHTPLRTGHVLPLGTPTSSPPRNADLAIARAVASPTTLEVEARLGPRDDMFSEAAIALLSSTSWTISHQTDRIAARLLGPRLMTDGAAQLPTEGLALGSVQVPSSGEPILHLANHPPTGGYPVIAVVGRSDVAVVSQAPPGTALRFRLRPALVL